ncbi:MAG: hypothetical protein PHI68_04925, partial [Candidatus Cloacimonetes bacterium]|nr:hypothetical protein [Candidatus Cloacimonadota bacterium]
MKRFYFLLLMVMLVCVSFAAIDDFYSFNATTGTYAAITGTDLTDISTDDAISGEVPIGFNFPYGDMSFTAVKVSSNGWIGLGTTQTYSNLTNALASTTYHPTIAPLWDDMSLATGTATYLTTGTAPNRVFTVQYANLQWNYWAGNAMNFQARFYENGKIDFIYGSYTGEPQNASASIGINMSPGGTGWFYSITPGTVPIASTTAENTSVSIYPNNGTVYEFLPAVASPNDLQALSILGNTTPSV